MYRIASISLGAAQAALIQRLPYIQNRGGEIPNFGILEFWNFGISKFPDYDATVPTVLIGCAPCQGFTAYRKKSWNQPDTRNSLVEAFADVAVSMQPDCVIISCIDYCYEGRLFNA